MRRATWTAGLVLVVTCVGGCSGKLVGHWRGVDVTGGDRQAFSLGMMAFEEDGTFEGIATLDGQKHELAGTYRFDGMHLTLDTDNGQYRYRVCSYNAIKPKMVVQRGKTKAKIVRVGK